MKDFEVIKIKENKTHCDGGKGALGHPRVYLTIANGQDSVTCPYCSRKFVLVPQR